MTNAFGFKNVTKRFGKTVALDHVTYSAPRQSVIGLIRVPRRILDAGAAAAAAPRILIGRARQRRFVAAMPVGTGPRDEHPGPVSVSSYQSPELYANA